MSSAAAAVRVLSLRWQGDLRASPLDLSFRSGDCIRLFFFFLGGGGGGKKREL